MKNARNQHRTDYAKELVKIVQTTKDAELQSEVLVCKIKFLGVDLG